MAKKKVEVEVDIETNVEGSIAQLKELKKQLKLTAAGSEEFKKLYSQIDDLEDKIKSGKNVSKDWVDTLEGAGGPLGMLGKTINSLKVSTVSFGTALKATGIGLLVSTIGLLVGAFSKSETAMKSLQPLMIQIEKLFGGLVTALQPLLDVFIQLAVKILPVITKGIGTYYAALVSLFTLVKEAGAGVGKILKGIFTLDTDSIKEGYTQLTGSWDKTTERYKEFQKDFKAGTELQTSTEKENAEARQKIREQELEKRKADLDAKIKLETDKENTSREKLKKLLDDRYKAELEGQKLSEAQKLVLRQENAKKLEEALKADDDKKKTEEENRKKKRLEELQVELDGTKGNAEQQLGVYEKLQQELTNATSYSELERQQLRKQYADAILQSLDSSYQAELNAIDLKYGEFKQFDANYYKDLKEKNDQNNLDLKAALDRGAISQQEYTKRLQANQKARQEIDKAEVVSSQQKTKLVGDALGQLSTIVGEDTVAGKGFAIAKATIDTYQSAVAAYKSLAGIPIIGPALGAIAAGAAVASGIATVKKITAVQVPNAPSSAGGGGNLQSTPSGPSAKVGGPISVTAGKGFAEGGFVRGPGSSDSDSIPAFLSDGEFVVNARSTRLFQPLLSAINNAGATPQFAVGGLAQQKKKPETDNTERFIQLLNDTLTRQPVRTYVTGTEITNQQQFDRTIKTRSLI